MNCFTVLGIEPTTEKKTIKRAYAAKSREFHPEEHPEEFQRIHDAYEEALAWAERNAGREEEPQMPEEPRRMEMGAAEQEKAAESETWNYAEPERNPEEAYMENPQKEDVQSEESSAQYEELPVHLMQLKNLPGSCPDIFGFLRCFLRKDGRLFPAEAGSFPALSDGS